MPQTIINGNTIVINVHLDYFAGTFSDFFDEHMEKGIIYQARKLGFPIKSKK
jgi:hypothetical protein